MLLSSIILWFLCIHRHICCITADVYSYMSLCFRTGYALCVLCFAAHENMILCYGSDLDLDIDTSRSQTSKDTSRRGTEVEFSLASGSLAYFREAPPNRWPLFRHIFLKLRFMGCFFFFWLGLAQSFLLFLESGGFSGPVVHRCAGPTVLWSCGSLVPWSPGQPLPKP